ncbi:hypothetical protein [Thioclava atlantica]|uniref:hypothetical protein n=1 Tax=Thioclava atlantica TaxID=1317124 RepID=UPI000A7D975C|nr:hypothetical protein [Thioclava atlantica]
MTTIIVQRYEELRPFVEIVGDRLLFVAAVLVALMGAGLIGIQLIEIFAPEPVQFHRI